MVDTKLRIIAGTIIVAMASMGAAQFTLNPSDTAPQSGANQEAVGGKAAFDLIPLREDKFSFPLRFAHVIPGSERVDLDGRSLTKGRDYTIDDESGVVYLKVQVKPNQSLRVQYRYDDKKKNEGTYGMGFAGGASNFRFNFAPGGQFVLGLGQTERLSDGTLINSNVYGMANAFNFGPGLKMTGVMMIGEREKSVASDMLGQSDGKTSDIESGQGTAIVQSLEAKTLGGTVKVDYQDIDTRFNGFSAMSDSGVDQKTVQQLAGEKGLKRTGFSFDGVSLGALKFSQGYSFVGDATGGITWRNYAMSALGVSAKWSSQYVDRDFNQFQGLREDDRKQLMKEKGLDRTNFELTSKVGTGALNYSNLSVMERDGEGVNRQNFKLDSKGLKVNYFDQSIGNQFYRFGDLREGEREQWSRERGMDRRAWDFSTGLFGMNFNGGTSRFGRELADISARDFGVGGKNWNFAYASRSVDSDFSDFGSLTNEDRQSLVKGVLGLYDPSLQPHGNDFNGIGGMAGFKRDGWRLGFGSEKGLNAKYQSSRIGEQDGDTLKVDEIALNSGPTKMSYRAQVAEEGFDGMGRLLWNEQRLLGLVTGLKKTDFAFGTKFGKSVQFDFGRMVADSPTGGAQRESIGLSGKGFGFQYARRAVDDTFTQIGGMVDPERDLMASLIGFDQSQASGFANLLPGMRLDFNQAQASNSITDEDRFYRSMQIGYALSKKTQLNLSKVNQAISIGDNNTLDQQYDMVQLMQDLGRTGKFTLTQETHRFDGSTDKLPDAQKQTLAYETKLNSSTDFKTEHSVTNYEDGNRETTASNTVATKLSNRVGVSVTDTRIRRDGDAPDETHRNYGFWVDFGGGIKLNYGYARNMQGLDGDMQSTMSVSGGTVGGVKLDGATYNTQRWDGRRDVQVGNVSFGNKEHPFAFGQVKDIQFYYQTNTRRDLYAWQQEEIRSGFAGAVGQFGFGFDYSSQISPSGDRAIDRVLSLTTDKSNKSRLRGTLKYGARTLPNDDYVLIRDYSLAFDVNKYLSIQNSVVTNPAQTKQNVLLGTVPLDERRNSWTVKYQKDPKLAYDLSWNEIKRDTTSESLKREARLNMTIGANSPSPFQFSYALQQWDHNNSRTLSHTFGLSFSQRPGPNQSFAFNIEHLNWANGRPENSGLRDWQFRLDYSLRF